MELAIPEQDLLPQSAAPSLADNWVQEKHGEWGTKHCGTGGESKG